MSKRVAIGIDLGTTNCCVGVFQNGRVEIIANDVGSRTTPSYVAFDDEEVHIGEAAKNQASVNSKNTVFENKRLIGRRFADSTVQEDMIQWPFEVIDNNGAPNIKVQYCEEEKVLPPEQISAMMLEKLKKSAEDFIGQEVLDAIITVPAYFNDSQRQATIDAGKIAGLNVLQILNEPTSAALAYGHFKKVVLDQTLLVFDLGGGTFDVSILTISNNRFVVKAVGGDTHLGGGDFDSRVTAYYLEKIKEKYNKDISQNPKSLGRLKKACETAKICLSTASRAKVDVACLFNEEDFRETLTRIKFEQLCLDLFKKTIKHVKNVLVDAGMNKSDIDEVILVGGSSRIPKIQELLSEFFDGKKLNTTINPDEAVAYGAAVKAALASGEHTLEEITLADVVPRSLGLKNYRSGNLNFFIERNSQIPLTKIQNTWSTTYNFTQVIPVDVYEGERTRAEDNDLLGVFQFDVGEKVRAGVPKLTFTFTIDENGILHVSGVNENTKCTAGISITSNKGRLTKVEIERMVQEVKQLKM